MILQHLKKLNGKRIVLASGSPRRKELLEQVGLQFAVQRSSFEEDLDKGLFSEPGEYVRATARGKGVDVWKTLGEEAMSGTGTETQSSSSSSSSCGEGSETTVVIACDTTVVVENSILEKPEDEEEAISMLSRLSGNSVDVISAVVLLVGRTGADADSDAVVERSWFETTKVHFAELDQQEVEAYVATGEPMDKAGAFGIQGQAGALITGIEGDYNTVVGFPLHSFCAHVARLVEEGVLA